MARLTCTSARTLLTSFLRDPRIQSQAGSKVDQLIQSQHDVPHADLWRFLISYALIREVSAQIQVQARQEFTT